MRCFILTTLLGLALLATGCPKPAPAPAGPPPRATTGAATPDDHDSTYEPGGEHGTKTGMSGTNPGGGTGSNLYGAAIEEAPISVTELMSEAAAYEGKTVTVEGLLGEVCQDMGCWFYLQDPKEEVADHTKDLYVDLQMGAVFTIPKDSAGKHGLVMGRVEKNGNAGWKIIGKGVQLS